MSDNVFTFIIIPLLVITLMVISRFVRKKMAKPKYKKGVQRPGKFDNFLLKFIAVLAIFCGMIMILGFVMGELEMAIVFLVLTVVFFGAVVILKNAYNMTYQENDEFFILKVKKEEYQVYYENIIDWQPSYNEIKILDESRLDEEYIKVNIAIFKPEILLRSVAEMTFDGKFPGLNNTDPNDPMREHEIVNYLVHNNYGHLIEDDINDLNR